MGWAVCNRGSGTNPPRIELSIPIIKQVMNLGGAHMTLETYYCTADTSQMKWNLRNSHMKLMLYVPPPSRCGFIFSIFFLSFWGIFFKYHFVIHPKNLISVSCVLCRGVPQWRLWAPNRWSLICCMCFYRDPNYSPPILIPIDCQIHPAGATLVRGRWFFS